MPPLPSDLPMYRIIFAGSCSGGQTLRVLSTGAVLVVALPIDHSLGRAPVWHLAWLRNARSKRGNFATALIPTEARYREIPAAKFLFFFIPRRLPNVVVLFAIFTSLYCPKSLTSALKLALICTNSPSPIFAERAKPLNR
jgi:hypothetical protein